MDRINNKVSPLKQLYHRWKALRTVPFRRKWFVGYDLEANTFWEFQAERGGRLRRLVDYYHEQRGTRLSIAEYSQRKVHPRWSSWLTFTRPTPPSLQELIADEQRLEVMKLLSARADERWRNESLLEDDKRILNERIILARQAINGDNNLPDHDHEVDHPRKRITTPSLDESPIKPAHIQPRR